MTIFVIEALIPGSFPALTISKRPDITSARSNAFCLKYECLNNLIEVPLTGYNIDEVKNAPNNRSREKPEKCIPLSASLSPSSTPVIPSAI